MGLSLRPDHVRRYGEIARLLLKYGRSDLLFHAGLTTDELSPPHPDNPLAGDDLAHDLERLGPTFVKVGQLLSTRADLLPPDALRALARLQDGVEPFSFDEVERIVSGELNIR